MTGTWPMAGSYFLGRKSSYVLNEALQPGDAHPGSSDMAALLAISPPLDRQCAILREMHDAAPGEIRRRCVSV